MRGTFSIVINKFNTEMKQVVIFLIVFIGITSCKDDIDLEHFQSNMRKTEQIVRSNGMQRVIVSSRSEIRELIQTIENNNIAPSRTSESLALTLSEDSAMFVSLLEANRQEVMSSLTQSQIDSIENDDEELEFYPEDSIIADIRFAQLLNADREIQVGDTIFKYVSNGVVYTTCANASDLEGIETIINQIPIPENGGTQPLKLTETIDFIPVDYGQITFEDSVISNKPVGNFEDGIFLSDNTYIPWEDVRNVNYKDKGDGNWLHRTWSGLWGRNIVAIKKFASNKKLTMNFYDQNYIIYSNIGTKLKMQKRVCGIWWNIKAEKMEQGWDAVSIKYTMPNPIPASDMAYPGMSNPTITTNHSYPFSTKDVVLFHIPFVEYDFTDKDMAKVFKMVRKATFEKASAWAKNKAKSENEIGLLCFNDKYAYMIHGLYYIQATNKRSIESKFYSKWFPGTCIFNFSLGETVNFKNISFSKNDGVELHRGRVYGAIKYNGKWLGAVITKDQD